MRKIFVTLLAIFGFAFGLKAQVKMGLNPENKNADARKELVKKMTPEEKREWLSKIREDMMVEDLDLSEKNKTEFKKIYGEYQNNQRIIKEKFNYNFNPEQLSDTEARKKLEESFHLGQELLNNRKECAKKMQSIMRPQQVLKMFQNEGKMREKMFHKKMELKDKENAAAEPSLHPPKFKR